MRRDNKGILSFFNESLVSSTSGKLPVGSDTTLQAYHKHDASWKEMLPFHPPGRRCWRSLQQACGRANCIMKNNGSCKNIKQSKDMSAGRLRLWRATRVQVALSGPNWWKWSRRTANITHMVHIIILFTCMYFPSKVGHGIILFTCMCFPSQSGPSGTVSRSIFVSASTSTERARRV